MLSAQQARTHECYTVWCLAMGRDSLACIQPEYAQSRLKMEGSHYFDALSALRGCTCIYVGPDVTFVQCKLHSLPCSSSIAISCEQGKQEVSQLQRYPDQTTTHTLQSCLMVNQVAQWLRAIVFVSFRIQWRNVWLFTLETLLPR